MTGSSPSRYDAIILGAGPAGFTAAIYLTRFRLKVLMIDAASSAPNNPNEAPAARSVTSGLYRNLPGYPEGVSREELKWLGIQQAQDLGCEYRIDAVVDIQQDAHGFKVISETQSYLAENLFFALGIEDEWPNLPDLQSFLGDAIYWSVESNGFEAIGKTAGVVGTDDHSAIDAIRLYQFTQTIYLFTLGEPLALSSEMQKLFSMLNITIVTEAIKTIIETEGQINGVILMDGRELPIQIFFIPSEKQHPKSQMAKKLGVTVDARGFIQVDDHFETNIPGIYAIGDITSRGHEQVITAYYQGMQAAWALYEDRFEHFLQQRLPEPLS